MIAPAASQEEEKRALTEAYAALNRNDIPHMVKAFDPQIEWVEFPESPGGGTYRGKSAVETHISQAREGWAEGSCEPEQFITSGENIVVYVHVRVRLKHEEEWREGRLADVYTFRNGKAVRFRCFLNREEALAWAGINSPT